MSRLPEVEILLATYNGARFLREQLDSIFAQDYENIRVLARDDGSGDETVEILQQYAQRFPGRLQLLPPGVMTGSAKENFLLLMQASTADHVCFCDQDDVWLPNKISTTRRVMDELESRWGAKVPLLVFSDLQVVDDQLGSLYPSFWDHMRIDPYHITRLATVLVQSVVTGCTVMVNRKLIELARRMPEEAFMHDRWIALLTASLGKAAIVESPTVLYRQHEDNVLGTGRNAGDLVAEPGPRSWVQRFRQPRIATGHLKYWEMSQREARALLTVHSQELPRRQSRILAAFLRCQTSGSRLLRVATFFRYGFYYPGIKENLATVLHLWRSEKKTASGPVP